MGESSEEADVKKVRRSQEAAGQCRFVWLMGLSNLSKDLFMGSESRGERGRFEESKGDRWSEGRSSSIAQSPRRGGGEGRAGAAGVLTSRNDLRTEPMGILLSEDPHVFPYLRPRLLPPCLLCLPNTRNLPTSNHFPTIFTQQHQFESMEKIQTSFCQLLEQKSSKCHNWNMFLKCLII